MKNKVIVYSTPQCANCDVAKRRLEANGIPYETIDISIDAEAKATVLNNGFRGVPVFKVVTVEEVQGKHKDDWIVKHQSSGMYRHDQLDEVLRLISPDA
jgi:glutaredoxin